MKEFQIPYNGGTSRLVLNDQPSAGVCLKATREPIVRHNGIKSMQIDFDEYFVYLCTNMIAEAPWPKDNVTIIRSLPKETYFALAEILGNEYPLIDFLSPAIKLMYGNKLDKVTFPSPTESITFSPNGESQSGK